MSRSVFSGGLLTLNNPVFSSYVLYGTAVTGKMLGVALLTTYRRVTKGVYATSEDVKAFGAKSVILDDEAVERARRNHLNDLENISPFLFLGLAYVTIDPDAKIALWHFRVFLLSRVAHTLSYQLGLQPARFLMYGVGIATCFSMLGQILLKLKG